MTDNDKPTTEAGRALLDDWRNDGPTYNFGERILAIEAEARDTAAARLLPAYDTTRDQLATADAEIQELREALRAAAYRDHSHHDPGTTIKGCGVIGCVQARALLADTEAERDG